MKEPNKIIEEGCPNCQCDCTEEELEKNMDGYCNECQRWYSCNHSKETPCVYWMDPCHYYCQECKESNHFTLDESGSKKWKLERIDELKREIKDIEMSI